MNAIDLLVTQHRSIETALQQVLDTDDESARARGFAAVADLLTVHIASEEEIFYPAVRAGRTEGILLESLEEHLSLKRLLADLIALDPREQTFVPKYKVLKEQSEHHHEEEEEHLFPQASELLGSAELDRLATQMLGLQQRLRSEGAPREAMPEQTDKAAPLK